VLFTVYENKNVQYVMKIFKVRLKNSEHKYVQWATEFEIKTYTVHCGIKILSTNMYSTLQIFCAQIICCATKILSRTMQCYRELEHRYILKYSALLYNDFEHEKILRVCTDFGKEKNPKEISSL
jgi:hypothetical protein